jgi:predicted ATPase
MPLLKQVQLLNFKSFEKTKVNLLPFTVLVGPNGAGKSNFVDALRFVKECLTNSLSLAVQNRGGISTVLRRSVERAIIQEPTIEHPLKLSGTGQTDFGFRLTIELGSDSIADFSFEISTKKEGAFFVKRERCVVTKGESLKHCYEVVNGKFKKEVVGIRPKIKPDHLALTVISAVEEFSPVYDFLSSMQFYSFMPDRIRQLQDKDYGKVLKPDGSNAAAVLREIQNKKKDDYERIVRLLSLIAPSIIKVEYIPIGQKETISFKQDISDTTPISFEAISMSDGTLRALGILLAVYQASSPSLIAIEEPESTIHPAALEVLVDILFSGAACSQILLTTHSPELLDDKDISLSNILVVSFKHGQTEIHPIGELSRKAYLSHLATLGELLTAGELEIDAPLKH